MANGPDTGRKQARKKGIKRNSCSRRQERGDALYCRKERKERKMERFCVRDLVRFKLFFGAAVFNDNLLGRNAVDGAPHNPALHDRHLAVSVKLCRAVAVSGGDGSGGKGSKGE